MPDLPLDDRPAARWRRGDLVALGLALVLIVVARVIGVGLLEQGRPIVLPWPPLLAFWAPHLGWGLPLAVACVAVGLALQRVAGGLRWRRLMVAGWLLNLAWLLSLVLIDGFQRGWVEVLLDPNEYLHDLPRIGDPLEFLATFTTKIAFFSEPGLDVWTTHVAGHPPLATLVFWGLERIGLGGSVWAGGACILASSLVSVSLPTAVRALGAEAAARRLVPFAALFPGAVWMAVSADGLFAGVATAGLALACVGAARRHWLASLAGGVLLGASLYLSYGLVLFGIVVAAAIVVTVRRSGFRTVAGPWLVATAGVGVVAATFFTLGFNWFTGLAELRTRYYQEIGSDRPFSYFVYANLAAWLISCSPLLAVGLTRALAATADRRSRGLTADGVVATLALSGLAAAVVADLSALSKAETERIWLSFGVVAATGMALLRGRGAAVALVGWAGWAVLVNSLLDTGW